MTRVWGLVLVCCALGCGPRLISEEDGPIADGTEESGGDVTETMLGGDTDDDTDNGDGDGDTTGTGDGDGGTPGDSGEDTKGDGNGDTTGDGDGDTTGDGDGDTTGDPYDPASCKPPAVVVPIPDPDIAGTTCSAPCMSDVDCPPAPTAGTVSLCALILDMGMLATNCALICDPAETDCPIGSSCKVVPQQMDVGVCTYP